MLRDTACRFLTLLEAPCIKLVHAYENEDSYNSCHQNSSSPKPA